MNRLKVSVQVECDAALEIVQVILEVEITAAIGHTHEASTILLSPMVNS